MRKILAIAVAALLFQAATLARASDVSFSINVGGPPIEITQPPDFIYPAELGFGVAVGVPYDMFYLDGVYYLYRGGGWYRTSYYGGSWMKVRSRELPPQLRKNKIARIHALRDREYRVYSKDREHYHGQHFRPEGRGGEEHPEMKEHRPEGRPDMQRHDERHDERGGEGRER